MVGGECGGERSDSSQTKPCNYTCLQGEEAQPDFNVWLQPQDRSLSRKKVAEGTRETHQAENKLVAVRQSPGELGAPGELTGSEEVPEFLIRATSPAWKRARFWHNGENV